jgi:hypothetical protein
MKWGSTRRQRPPRVFTNPVREELAERQARAEKALIRAGYTEYPIVVPTNRVRLGIDRRKP